MAVFWGGVERGGVSWAMLPTPGLSLVLRDKCGAGEGEAYLGTGFERSRI